MSKQEVYFVHSQDVMVDNFFPDMDVSGLMDQ